MNKKRYMDWSPERIQSFREVLFDWYDREGRAELPWRQTKDPYAIWVSEIMLQQTQVNTVIPYYERFIDELPTIEALSKTSEDHLHHLWQGLGYYSRVRNMQTAAQQMMEQYEGKMPQSMADLLNLKGIGPYTAAAIGSIAFNLVEPAIDGNLMRVIARLFEVGEDIGQVKNRKIFSEILYTLIDPNRPGDFNQALMDIGATVMTPHNDRPDPHPLARFDRSFQKGTSHLYPVKEKRIKNIQEQRLALLIRNHQGQLLMRKHQVGELLQGLWHYPMIKWEGDDLPTVGQVQDLFWSDYGQDSLVHEGENEKRDWQANRIHWSSEVKHVFSHRTWFVRMVAFDLSVDVGQFLSQLDADETFTFVDFEDMPQLALSSLQEKLIAQTKKSFL